jgi:hypothetical protein
MRPFSYNTNMRLLRHALLSIVVIVLAPTLAAQPINDFVVTSRPLINAPTASNGTNVDATAEGDLSASCTFGSPDNDGDNSVWWWFRASADGTVTIDLNGSSFDTIVSVYNSTLTTEVACNDDDPNGGLTSRIDNLQALFGDIFFIRVTGFQGAEGDIALSLDGPVTAPAEDEVGLQMPFETLYPITTIGSTEGGPVGDASASCTNDGTNSSWRTFTGTGSPVTLYVEMGGFDTVMTILDENLNELACDDDGGEGTLSRIDNFQTESGVTYFVRLAGFGGDEGNARIRRVNGGSTSAETPATPEVVSLDAAYPNPFADRTAFPVVLPEAADMHIEAYDVLGREVAVLAHGAFSAGPHEITFDASKLPSGVYMVRMTVGKTVLTRRVTVVR